MGKVILEMFKFIKGIIFFGILIRVGFEVFKCYRGWFGKKEMRDFF